MLVTCGKKEFILAGPPVTFVGEPERPDAVQVVQEQMKLFA